MTYQDALEYVGLLFGCYSAGWCVGFLILYFKKLTEQF